METVKRLRRLTGHCSVDAISMHRILGNLIDRGRQKLRSDIVINICLETLQLGEQGGLEYHKQHRRDVGIAHHVSSCGLERQTHAVDIAYD